MPTMSTSSGRVTKTGKDFKNREEQNKSLDSEELKQRQADRLFSRVKAQNKALPAFLVAEKYSQEPLPEEGSVDVDFLKGVADGGKETVSKKQQLPDEVEQLHPAQRELLRDALKTKILSGPKGMKLEELFARIDEDGSGTLEPDELVKAIREVFQVTPGVAPDSQIYAFFRLLDTDGGGEISVQEMMDFIQCAQNTPKRGYRQMIRPKLDDILETCAMLNEVAEYQKKNEAKEEEASEGGSEAPEKLGFDASNLVVDASGKLVNAAKQKAEQEARLAAIAKRQAGNAYPKLAKIANKPPAAAAAAPAANKLVGLSRTPRGQRGAKGGNSAVREMEQYNRRREEEAQVLAMQQQACSEEERQRLIHERQVRKLQTDPGSLSQMLKQVVKTAW